MTVDSVVLRNVGVLLEDILRFYSLVFVARSRRIALLPGGIDSAGWLDDAYFCQVEHLL